MSNQTRLGSYNTSPVDVTNLLGAQVSQDHDTSYPTMYNMQSSSLPLGQPFDTMNSHSSWPFQMSNLQEEHSDVANHNSDVPGHGQNVQHTLSREYSGYSDPTSNIAVHEAPPSTSQRSMLDRQRPIKQEPSSSAPSDTGKIPSNVHLDTHKSTPHATSSVQVPASTSTSAPDQQEASARANSKKRSPAKGEKDSKTGRRKIKIEFIDDDSRRHITFSKRKAGIMKKVCATREFK